MSRPEAGSSPFCFLQILLFGLVNFGRLGPVGFSDFAVFMAHPGAPGSFQGVCGSGPAFKRDAIG